MSSDVFERIDCLEKKWPLLFSDQEKLNVASDFCSRDLEGYIDIPFFEYVQDLIGSNNVKSLVEYKQIKSIWNIIRTIGSPTLYDSEGDIHYEGQLYLKKEEEDFIVWDLNMPLSPVMSSVVQSRAVKDDKLYVRFHSSPENTYKYKFEGNDEAVAAYNEMTDGSPGRWVWKNLRGHSKGEATGIENVPEKYGRVSGSGKLVKKKGQSITRTGEKKTIGGIGSEGYKSKPYEKIGKVIQGIEEVPQMEALAKQMREYKMSVKAEESPEEKIPGREAELAAGGTSGEPFRPGEIKQFQKKLYEEKVKRKKIKDDVKTMLSKIKTQKFKQTKTKKATPTKKDKTITKPNDALSRHTKKLGKDFDDRKGKWITVKGKHIFIKKGEKLQFGHGGRVEVVSQKEHAERKEAKTQKKIEKTGIQRKTAEKHVKQKRKAKKEKYGYQNISKEVKKVETQAKIDKKKEVLKSKYEKLIKVNKGKPGSEILKNVVELAVKALIAAQEGDITSILSDINKYRKKVKNDHKLTEAQRQRLAEQINSIRDDIDKLQLKQDFEVEDSFNDLFKWVQENIASDPKAAKEIAFRILQSKRSKGKTVKKEKKEETPKTTKTPDWNKEWGWLKKHFETLGLPKENITRKDVKFAFYKKAKETHPDRKGGDPKKFMEVHTSYEKLLNELKYHDFDGIDTLIEIAELEVELENYDYYFDNNSEEYENYIRGIENE